MDTKHEFCDRCPRCRPALLDVYTGQVLPDHSPEMRHINQVWDHDTT